MRLKDEKGQFVSEEEANLGYYIFDLETQQVKLLKIFEDGKRGKGFWWEFIWAMEIILSGTDKTI